MAKNPKKPLDPKLPIYQLKITLQHVEPPIWRRIQTSNCSLEDLHEIIQVAMGWDDEHQHAFVVEGEEFGNPVFGGDFDHDSRFVRLGAVLEHGYARFRYDYDFGDDWQHHIDIEKTLPIEPGVCYPRCLAGERACPPEDCGGPYGYPEFLETLENPEDKDHEETLEWVGEFDPNKFDLDDVNQGLYHLRRWLGRRRGKVEWKATFAKGELVRVKPGVVHKEYPDLPLGGWVGRVKRLGWLVPIGYAIRWTEPTLAQAHPVFFKRCQRDDVKPQKYWLEEGQLETATEETPVAMEQPTNLAARPLSPDEPGDRVRAIFGLTGDDPLPENNELNQQHFLDYLGSRFSFPFKATYFPVTELGPRRQCTVTVLGFADPPLHPKSGIVCQARKANDTIQVPLISLHVVEDEPNVQFVADYTCWWWESEDFEDDDEPGPHRERFQPSEDKGLYDEDFKEEKYQPPQPIRRESPPIGRNDPCPCGSGKKYKKCCLNKDKQ